MMFLLERIGRLVDELSTLRYPASVAIPSYRMLKSADRFSDVAHLDTSSWETFDCQQIWGGHREYYWFATEVQIPASFDGKCVAYRITTGREGNWDATNPQFSVYINGKLRQGFDVNHRELILSDCAKAGETFSIVLSAFTGDQNFSLLLKSELLVLDQPTEQYYYDVLVPYQAASILPKDDTTRIRILQALNDSLNLLDLREPYNEAYYQTLREASHYLTTEFYEKQKTDCKETVFCVGHTHIDCAWLWSMAVTKDKAVRSFSTVLELMRRYPEYTFMSSQPLLYEFVKENAPEVYAEIKERIAEGRWEVNGGMWVEADCNITSGESLVRQFLVGQRFFKEEFGKDNDILWLPDVFGYSAALPQIMEQCGIPYFMTTKISWNEVNKLPYDTFLWEGIDGTRVLTHFVCTPTAEATDPETVKESFNTTYNGNISPWKLNGAWQRYQQKALNHEVLNCFGYGDGGGGPTKEMLEIQRRTARSFPGCIPSKPAFASEFFHKLDEEVRENRELPVWVGELYLEYHRGTYTSMARNKKYNRRSEFAAQNAELYAYLADRLTGLPYPKQMLYDQWKMILRNQFHDILPGSSIKEVYDDSKREYEELLGVLGEIQDQSLQALANAADAPIGAVLVANPNGSSVPAVVTLAIPANTTLTDGETIFTSQVLSSGQTAVSLPALPSKGYAVYTLCPAAAEAPLTASTEGMENAFFRIRFNELGQFTSIYDKRAKRELLKPDASGNVLMTYEDKPHNYDAWDINNYYSEKSWPVDDVASMEVVECGGVLASVRIKRRYLSSEITQTITLYRDAARIDIQNDIDWHEHQILLKSLFPLDIHTNEATFEIQYGNVTRPTHYNTSWDAARFEVCHHKWMDVSEDDFGVSFLNDCKFGCHVHDGVVGLTMLKSALYPNPDADKERHQFTYSIFPHTGSWKTAGTVDEAYALNNPPVCRFKETEGGKLPLTYSLVSCDAENVVIEVTKEAEDSNALIVRLYEYFNRRTETTLRTARPMASACVCNMMEEEDQPLTPEQNTLSLKLRPYEIKTLKLTF